MNVRSLRAHRTAAVVVTALMTSLFAAPAAQAQGTAPCPSYYYCFYENNTYNRTISGWHLNYNTTTSGSFKNPPGSTGDRRNDLVSIINNGNRTICIWDDLTLRKDVLLKRVAPYEDVPTLGTNSNKADYWRVFAGNSACA